ncbi:MAG: hypothetical protein K9M45_04830 [Kiritimatiellales bacterium]|nr:hypothetical protein [Kiritimatiellales bacterium]
MGQTFQSAHVKRGKGFLRWEARPFSKSFFPTRFELIGKTYKNLRRWTSPKAAPHYQRFFEFPTQKEFTTELQAMKDALSKQPSLELPKKDGTRQKAFTIYAWNVFGKDGIVAPTKGKRYMMLECIKGVFGKAPASDMNTKDRQVEQSPAGDVLKAAPKE